MIDYKETVEKLVSQSEQVNRGSLEQVRLLEKAIQIADSHQDTALQVSCRETYIEATTYASLPEKAMVAFAFVLAHYDAAPDEFSFFKQYEILWKYKWVVNKLHQFVAMDKQRIAGALADMEARYTKEGFSLKAVHQCSYSLAFHMGDMEAAKMHYTAYEKEERGMMGDCKACSLSRDVDYLIAQEKYEGAITASEPILAGEMTCATLPNEFYSKLFLPFIKTGQTELAVTYYEKIKAENNRNFLVINGDIINLLTVKGEWEKAIELLENNLLIAQKELAKSRTFDFYLAANFLLATLKNAGQTSIKLTLPSEISFYSAEGVYEIAAIQAFLQQETATLEQAFNARNGNDYFSIKRSRIESLKDFVQVPTLVD